MPRYDDLMKLALMDVMTPEFIYAGTETKLTKVLELIINHGIGSSACDREGSAPCRHNFAQRPDALFAV